MDRHRSSLGFTPVSPWELWLQAAQPCTVRIRETEFKLSKNRPKSKSNIPWVSRSLMSNLFLLCLINSGLLPVVAAFPTPPRLAASTDCFVNRMPPTNSKGPMAITCDHNTTSLPQLQNHQLHFWFQTHASSAAALSAISCVCVAIHRVIQTNKNWRKISSQSQMTAD